MNNQIKKNKEEENISIFDIFVAFANHIKLILIFPIIFVSSTIFYVFFIADPLYSSSSKIKSASGGGSFSQATGLAAQFGFSLPTQSESNWVYPEIIRSRTLARAMLSRKFDSQKHGTQKSLLEILTYDTDTPNLISEMIENIAIENFLLMLNVSADIKTSINTITITALEARLSTDINSALLEELDRHQKNFIKTKTSKTKLFIEERILETEKELMGTEEDLKIFMDRNRRIENSPSLLLEEQRLTREVTVLTGVFTTLKQQLENTKIEEVKDSDYIVIIDPPELPLRKSKPNKKVLVFLAGFSGLFFGGLLASFRELVLNSSKEEKNKINLGRLLIKKNIIDLIKGKIL